MGLTKQYLRYVPSNVFGIIAGTRCNIKLIKYKGVTGKYAAVGACEFVLIWDLKKGETVLKLTCDGIGSKTASEVTCIEQDFSHNSNKLAVGYLDGSLRIFDLLQPKLIDLNNQTVGSALTLNGHKTAITSIKFDNKGVRLVSGSKDTDLVIWDLVEESGLFRLKGHKAPISNAIFMNKHNIVISCGKDMLVKFWDLDTRHCFKTIVSHRSEVNDLILFNGDQTLITGCHDNELRVFELKFNENKEPSNDEPNPSLKKLKISDQQKDNDDDEEENESNDSPSILTCNLIGSLVRESKDALNQICLDQTRTVFSSHSANEKHLELYRINSDEEIKKRLAKKLKKQKRKQAVKSPEGENQNEQESDDDELSIEQTVEDKFTRVSMLKTKHKIKYVDLICEFNASNNSIAKRRNATNNKEDNNEEILFECKMACLLQNNQIEVYLAKINKQINNTKHPELLYSINIPGHRTDVRTISFSSDSTAFISASGDCMKVWNRLSLNCIRTFPCDYALCSSFFDDNHVLIGTKSGKIQLFNINASDMLENVIAHDDDTSIWSICLLPDKSGFVSGGADKTVRFWNFELIDDEENKNKKKLSFNHSRTLKLDDDVLSIRISPNGRLIAVALLDTTVKVFFVDSLKMFLNLYGHKQPVLTMDISFDNRIILTGSSDRHIKIWGLDFGDCHKSIYAHEDSIMNVQFVAKTHYFFSVGKDGKLKEWDADKFERIITLDGHLNEIWSMGISNDGKFVVTGSHDKTMRLWEKTNEPLVLEDERETEKEQQYENEIPKEEQIVAGELNRETGLATIKTIETIKSAEKLIESINIYLEEQHKLKLYQIAVDNAVKEDKSKIKLEDKHPILIAMNDISGEEYVLQTLKKTKASEIETTLLVLEFEHVRILLDLLCYYLKKNLETELCLKCAIFILKINYGQITTTQTLLPLVEQLREMCFNRINNLQNTVGFNIAALGFLKNQVEENEQIRLFSDMTIKAKDKNKKQKKVTLLSLKSASSVS